MFNKVKQPLKTINSYALLASAWLKSVKKTAKEKKKSIQIDLPF